MKLYTMKCIKAKDQNVVGNIENFVKFTRDIEQQTYDESIGFAPHKEYLQGLWDGYMSAWLEWDTCDENVYCYIGVDEDEVAVGGGYTDADGLVWERVG